MVIQTNPKKIYLVVDKEHLSAIGSRKSYKILNGLLRISSYVVEYDVADFCSDDLKVIVKHNSHGRVLDVLGDTICYSFTHYKPFELIRERKVKLCKELGVEPDGSIFGTVKTVERIPQRIIPAHDRTHSVEWQCFDDNMTIESYDEHICSCCENSY